MNIQSKITEHKMIVLKKGLSVTDYAKNLDINISYANQIINGKRSPSPKLAKKMAEFLGVDIEKIFILSVVNNYDATTKQ
ncbi:helix-turn-helix transcriptional regulator [Staphylococcus pseudintermedius]|nr:helix-turn-helix transcriptional regulator [Staphylococcus pseudintermedius]